MKYWFEYQLAKIELKWCRLVGRIGEWFLWQEWKHFGTRVEFSEAIQRFRGKF